jgi:acyl-CoA hydrolase
MQMLKGGRLLQWMDNTAAICAQTFAGKICVTVGINEVCFLHPARIGDMISIRAVVSKTFTSSMAIKVEAWARAVGQEQPVLITRGVFSFVAIGKDGKPTPLQNGDQPGDQVAS